MLACRLAQLALAARSWCGLASLPVLFDQLRAGALLAILPSQQVVDQPPSLGELDQIPDQCPACRLEKVVGAIYGMP